MVDVRVLSTNIKNHEVHNNRRSYNAEFNIL